MKISYLEELTYLLEGLHMKNIDLIIKTTKDPEDYFILGSIYYNAALDKIKESKE